jgi:hypothetical protein
MKTSAKDPAAIVALLKEYRDLLGKIATNCNQRKSDGEAIQLHRDPPLIQRDPPIRKTREAWIAELAAMRDAYPPMYAQAKALWEKVLASKPDALKLLAGTSAAQAVLDICKTFPPDMMAGENAGPYNWQSGDLHRLIDVVADAVELAGYARATQSVEQTQGKDWLTVEDIRQKYTDLTNKEIDALIKRMAYRAKSADGIAAIEKRNGGLDPVNVYAASIVSEEVTRQREKRGK